MVVLYNIIKAWKLSKTETEKKSKHYYWKINFNHWQVLKPNSILAHSSEFFCRLSSVRSFNFFIRTSRPISTRPGTKHPLVKGTNFFFKWRATSFSMAKILWRNLKIQNHSANFNQTWHKRPLGEGNSSLFKWRDTPFSKER